MTITPRAAWIRISAAALVGAAVGVVVAQALADGAAPVPPGGPSVASTQSGPTR